MVANNSFVDQGVTYIKAAVAADEKGDYENALKLYQDGVGRVAMAIKYEKNESSRKLLMERCDGWLKRAEELKDRTGGGASPTGGGKGEGKENGSGKTDEDDKKKDDEDTCTNNDKELSEDDKKLRGALGGKWQLRPLSKLSELPSLSAQAKHGFTRSRLHLRALWRSAPDTVGSPAGKFGSPPCNNWRLPQGDGPRFQYCVE